jgi:hypothetical protein
LAGFAATISSEEDSVSLATSSLIIARLTLEDDARLGLLTSALAFSLLASAVGMKFFGGSEGPARPSFPTPDRFTFRFLAGQGARD